MQTDVEVLILTSDLDFATDRVCRELARSGVAFLRLNREQLPDVALELDPVSAQLRCRVQGDVWRIADSLRSVWWRQGTFDRNISDTGFSLDEQLIRSQWSAFMRSLMVFDWVRWFNHPARVYEAETKAVQLRTAARLGFDVPPTLMTNDRYSPVGQVIGDRVAVKSVDTLLLRDGAEQMFGYTTIVPWHEVATSDLAQAPLTAQAPLENKLDLRVTVLGALIWCAEIRRGGEGVEGDWRLTLKDQLEISAHQVPASVAAKCVGLVEALGLRYGAIDLALADGRYWFIEINPTGEWGWLDTPERPLAAAIAEQLAWTS